MVFDASGARMAWTLIEQLQGELGRGAGRPGGDWAGSPPGEGLGEGASPPPALL